MTAPEPPKSMEDENSPTGRASYSEGFAFGAISFILGGVLAVLTGIITARLYGIHVVGEFALANAPTGAVWSLSTAREQPALVRALAPYRPRDPHVTGLFAAVFTFSSALTVVVSILAGIATWFLFNGSIDHPGLFAPAMASLAGYVFFTNPSWNLDTVMTAFRAGKQLFWIRLFQALAFLVFALVGYAAGATVWGLVLAVIGSFVTSLIHRIMIARHWIRVPVPKAALAVGFAELPEMLRFGIKITPGALANGISNEVGTWILGATSSIATVGAYNRAWSMSQRFLEVNFRVTEMLFPTLVERHEIGDHEAFDRALLDSIRYIAIVLLLPASVAGGAATGVMSLYGAGFERGSTALAILLVVPTLLTTVILQMQALLAVNRPLATTVVSVARAVVTIAAGIAFSVWLGITGMAIAMVLGGLVQFALQCRATRPHIATPLFQLWPGRQLLGLFGAYVLGFIVSRGLDDAVPQPWGLLLGLSIGTLVYAATIFFGAGFAPRDRHRAEKLFRRIRGRPQAEGL